MNDNLDYAHIIIPGVPKSKSNFSLHNRNTGKKFMPKDNEFSMYEELIVACCIDSTRGKVFEKYVIAHLKMYYKSSKRHTDTANMPKSIFDGIEKSGIIKNDVFVRKIYLEEFYDVDNPRVEVLLYDESKYRPSFSIEKISEAEAQNENSFLKCSGSCSSYFPLKELKKFGGRKGYYCSSCIARLEQPKNKKEKDDEAKKCLNCGSTRDLKKTTDGRYVCLKCILK